MVGERLKSIAPNHTDLIVTLVTSTLAQWNVPNVRVQEKRRKKMRIDLTVFDNKEAEVICDIIYEKLCDLGLNPEGFTWLIDVEIKEECS